MTFWDFCDRYAGWLFLLIVIALFTIGDIFRRSK